MKSLLVAALILSVSMTSAMAAHCRDSSGKFIKCPAVMTKVVHCKDKAGKFAKCSAPGAHPI